MRNLIVILLTLLCGNTWVQAGVVIGATRVVYGAQQNSVALSLRNNSPFSWLINSKISTGGRWAGTSSGVAKAPFVITPPLFSLKAGRESTLRIIHTGGKLPQDRESLFTLSIATIPSGQPGDNSVQIAVRSRLKLFYRPAGLKGSAQNAWRKLRWSLAGNQLRVENPTPYYVTLYRLGINGRAIRDAGVVAPFSQRLTRWCQAAQPCMIRWQSINDYGRIMPVQHVSLTGK